MNPLLLPLVAAQGLRARRTIEVLPEAAGPRAGVSGEGPTTRLLVIGESTAAGVGAPSHDEALAGSLARGIGGRVEWQVLGRSGATAQEALAWLPEVSPAPDLAVVVLGVNDTLRRTSPRAWARHLAQLLDGIPAARVVVTGVPSFASFPSLPNALARYLDERARRLDEAAQQVCDRPEVTWVSSVEGDRGVRMFARDGFHPSPEGYAGWAQSLLDA